MLGPIPVVIITASSLQQRQAPADVAGFLSKPINWYRLFELVECYCAGAATT